MSTDVCVDEAATCDRRGECRQPRSANLAWISSARCASAVLTQVGRVPAASRSPMFSLALARRIARPPLVGRPATAFARWYAASQANFATEGEKVIYDKLTEKFRPTELHVEDVSGEQTHCGG